MCSFSPLRSDKSINRHCSLFFKIVGSVDQRTVRKNVFDRILATTFTLYERVDCIYVLIATYTAWHCRQNYMYPWGARWLSGRASDSGARGRGSKPTSSVLCP